MAVEGAVDVALATPGSFTKCIIYANRQAAILGINGLIKQSGQSLLISAVRKTQTLADAWKMTIESKWVSEHVQVKGNEEADKVAKMAPSPNQHVVNSTGQRYQAESISMTAHQNWKSEVSEVGNWRQPWTSAISDIKAVLHS